MGTTKSKTIVEVPVQASHEGSNDFVSHHIHTGTLRSAIGAMLILLIILALGILLCKKFMKRFRMERQIIPGEQIVRYETNCPREVLPKLG